MVSNLQLKRYAWRVGFFPPQDFVCAVQLCIYLSNLNQLKCLFNLKKAVMFIYLRFYLFIFRERGREGERQGEEHQCVRETSINTCPDQGRDVQPRHVA